MVHKSFENGKACSSRASTRQRAKECISFVFFFQRKPFENVHSIDCHVARGNRNRVLGHVAASHMCCSRNAFRRRKVFIRSVTHERATRWYAVPRPRISVGIWAGGHSGDHISHHIAMTGESPSPIDERANIPSDTCTQPRGDHMFADVRRSKSIAPQIPCAIPRTGCIAAQNEREKYFCALHCCRACAV